MVILTNKERNLAKIVCDGNRAPSINRAEMNVEEGRKNLFENFGNKFHLLVICNLLRKLYNGTRKMDHIGEC